MILALFDTSQVLLLSDETCLLMLRASLEEKFIRY